MSAAEHDILESIRNHMEQIPGHTGFYYLNLSTGAEYSIRAEETFGAASVIKLPLFLHILSECAAGRIDMNEKLTITAEDKVPICGALTLFSEEISVDIRTLCRLMISISDNTATNKLIDRCTIPELQEGFRHMGLEKTQLTRKLFDRNASRMGLRNTISPREIGLLLAKIARNEFISPEISREAVDTLLLQQVDHKLNGRICGEVPIAHKTGEDDHLSNDVGIVYAPQPFVVCFAGHDTDVYMWEDLMRNATYELYKIQLK